jgi:hypothetical protein
MDCVRDEGTENKGCGDGKRNKRRLGNHAMLKEVLPIPDRLENELNGNVDRLKDGELKALLKWKGVPASKMGNVAAKKVLYKKNHGRGRRRQGG